VTDVREILGDKIDEEITLGIGRSVTERRHGEDEDHLKNQKGGQEKFVGANSH
jgi:hypothetical protein